MLITKNESDDLVTYYFINKTLNMSPGKVAVQCARAAMIMLSKEADYPDSLMNESLSELFKGSQMNGNKTITLKANSNQLNRLLTGDLNNRLTELSREFTVPIRLYPTYDVGRTEVPENSLTVIAMTPVKQSIISCVAKKFNLY